MKNYRVFFNPKTRTVLAFEWTEVIKTTNQRAPNSLTIATWVFESTPLSNTTTKRNAVISEKMWQSFAHSGELTTGHFNETVWINYGFEFMGVISMGNLTSPAEIHGHLSGMIDHAETLFMDTSFLSESNMAVAKRLHEAMWNPDTSERMKWPVVNLGTVLTSDASRSKYDF